MSDMNGNPHYRDARAAGSYYATRQINSDLGVIALAQVEATLALAHEQRTANLIALMAMSPLDLTDWPQPAVDNFLTQNKNICTRLGLNEGATK